MSDNAEPRPQNGETTDPWAPPPGRGEDRVDLGKRPAADRPVHDQQTVASIPTGEMPPGGPAGGAPTGGELPPPPVAPGGPSAYGAPTPPPSYGYPAAGPVGPAYGYPPAHPVPYGPLPGQNNGMGTAGMVLGIVGTCIFWFYGIPAIILGVLALIFGIIGRKRVGRGEASNGGAATAGIVLGIVSMVFGAAFIAFLVAVFVSVDEYMEEERGTRTSTVLVVDGHR
ncbi:DUF4190 domain-containing protein [Streptomyces sp. CC208A]|uniref:DUF4190 domain-containing protein n=1 Tax=Streptomyces sp. CC208A TaxID=3044573 RepID=UPI0024A94B1F|nr:DUF4190 domain-containing protein [Streptomyces sp. CC208A]